MATNAKIYEAREHCKAAERAVKTTMFRWKVDYDSAADEYSQAAQCYRIARDLANSKDCHLKASECYRKNNAFFHAAKALENAIIVCKETAPPEEIYKLAVDSASLYQQHGSGDSGASVLDKAAKILEEKNAELAVKLFQQAADVSSIVALCQNLVIRIDEWEQAQSGNVSEAQEAMQSPAEELYVLCDEIWRKQDTWKESSDNVSESADPEAPGDEQAQEAILAPADEQAQEAILVPADEQAQEAILAPADEQAQEAILAPADEIIEISDDDEDSETPANAVNSANAANAGNSANSANAANSSSVANSANVANSVNAANSANAANWPKAAPRMGQDGYINEYKHFVIRHQRWGWRVPAKPDTPVPSPGPMLMDSGDNGDNVRDSPDAQTESSQHQGSEYISKASRILVKLQRYDQAVDSLRREIGFHQESGNTGAIGRLTVAIVLVQLARGDAVAAEKAYKEWGSNCEVAEMQTLEQILQAYDEEDRESAKRALASPFIRNMDVEYARLAASVPLPEAMEPAPRAAVRENAAPSYVSANATATTTAEVCNEEVEESPYAPVTYAKKSDDEDGLC